MPATRVAVVDDHQLVRIGLKQIIESQPDFAWAGEASNGREALALLRAAPCDVLLLDLSLPDMSGLDVLRQIKAHHESVATLVLSAYPENQYGLNVLRAGASGFVSKTADDGELCRALKDPARNGGRSMAALVHHMTTDALVQWAWSPGKRTAPSVSQFEFHEAVKRWAVTGAACPS